MKKPSTVRFGVSFPPKLLAALDDYCQRGKIPTRSEALRKFAREALVEEKWSDDAAEVVAAVTLVYDHHSREIQRRLHRAQHASPKLVVSTLHIHLDHDNCVEVVILRGSPKEVRELADGLAATRGVLHHGITLTGTVPVH